MLRLVVFAVDGDDDAAVFAFFDVVWHIFCFFFDFFVLHPDKSFDLVDDVLRLQNCFTLREISDQELVTLDIDDRRSGSSAFSVSDDFRFVTHHIGDSGVGSSKINTDNFWHV